MKKTLIAFAFAFAASASMAVDVGVTAFRDFNSDQNGAKVTLSQGNYGGFKPTVTLTSINNSYLRYSAGVDYNIFTSGKLTVGANVSGVYQDSYVGSNGFGLVGGLKTTYALSPKFDVVGSVERFVGQERINYSNGLSVGVGLVTKF